MKIDVCAHPGPLSVVSFSSIPGKTVVQCLECTSMWWEASDDPRIQRSMGKQVAESLGSAPWPCALKEKRSVTSLLDVVFTDELPAA